MIKLNTIISIGVSIRIPLDIGVKLDNNIKCVGQNLIL